MTLHSASDWQKIFEDQATNSVSAADRILGDLIGYNHTSKHRSRDAEELASALAGWRMYMEADEEG